MIQAFLEDRLGIDKAIDRDIRIMMRGWWSVLVMLKTWGWSIQRFALPALSEPINCRYRDSIVLQRFYACRSVCIDHTTKSCVGCIVKKSRTHDVANSIWCWPPCAMRDNYLRGSGSGLSSWLSPICCQVWHREKSLLRWERGGCKEPLYYSLSDLSNVESFFHSIVVSLAAPLLLSPHDLKTQEAKGTRRGSDPAQDVEFFN